MVLPLLLALSLIAFGVAVVVFRGSIALSVEETTRQLQRVNLAHLDLAELRKARSNCRLILRYCRSLVNPDEELSRRAHAVICAARRVRRCAWCLTITTSLKISHKHCGDVRGLYKEMAESSSDLIFNVHSKLTRPFEQKMLNVV